MKTLLSTLAGLLFVTCGLAQSDFSSYQKRVLDREQSFESFKASIVSRWGRYEESTIKSRFDYSQDGRTRQQINFSDDTPEDGFVEFAIVDAKNSGEAQKRLLDKLGEALSEQAGEIPILEDQVLLDGRTLQKQLGRKEQQKLKKQVKREEISLGLNRTKTIYIVRLPLAPDHVKRRAEKYRKLIEQYAKEFRVPTSLILAIIHTESWYNPHAKSGAPAYGLMQLVPKSGARDAYRRVFRKDRVVEADYLYDPENNIRLGVAYIRILLDQLNKVENERSRIYLAISGYNTGLGNVSRAFIKSRKLRRAFDPINQMEPGSIYNHLKRRLPYRETRDYLVKVTDRMDTVYRQ